MTKQVVQLLSAELQNNWNELFIPLIQGQVGIGRLNQSNLPRASPTFDLLFSLDCVPDVLRLFGIEQVLDSILPGEG